MPKTRHGHFCNLVFNMILRTHQIPKNIFCWKHFPTLGTEWDPTDFPYKLNTGKYKLRNHFQGRCFPLKLFFNESRAGPARVSVQSRSGLSGVPCGSGWVLVKFWLSPSQVSGRSQVGPGWISVKSWVSPGQVPGMSQASPMWGPR